MLFKFNMKKNNLDKKIIKFFIIFIISAIFIILLLNNIYVTSVLTKKTFYRKELDYYTFVNNIPDKKLNIIFFGDSHPFHDINPVFFNKSYNYGSGSENYIKSYYKLRKIIEKDNLSIDKIILQLDPHTFSTYYTKDDFLFNELPLYSRFVSQKEIKEILQKDSFVKIFIESYLPVIGRGEEFGIFIKSPEWTNIKSGWIINNESFSEKNKSYFVDRSFNLFYKGQNMRSNISLEYFFKMIKYAKVNNITVILLTYPHSKEYSLMIKDKNISLDNYYSYLFKEIEKSIGCNYYYINYYDIYFNKSEYFGDDTHLNYQGATEFSQKIKEDMANMSSFKSPCKKEFKD